MSEQPWHSTCRRYNLPLTCDTTSHSSVVALMAESIDRFGDKTAFCSFGQTLSFREYDQQANAFCAWLQSEGVKKGDRVAVMVPNLIAFPIAFLGIARAGAVQVNVNPLYTPRELSHQLRDADCETIVIFTGVTATLADILEETQVTRIICARPGDGTQADLPSPPVDERLASTIAFADTLQQGSSMTVDPVDIDLDDLLFLQYTGGTTGLSKGAALNHGNLIANIAQFKVFMASTNQVGEEVIVTAIPLYHIFALMVNFLTYFSDGAENWLVANPRDGDSFVDTLAAARPSVFMGVNTMYAALCQHPRIRDVDWSRLHLSGGGGAAIVPAVSAQWEEITGGFICEGYGLSETGPVLSFNPDCVQSFNATTGLPLADTDIILLDDNDQIVAQGESGEVCARGPQVMPGYWRNDEANAQVFTSDGFFRTGDIGLFDADGFLKIVDRKKDMILVSGFNVYPNEIESVVTGFEHVVECACIGIANDKTGEAVKLFVVGDPALDHDKLRDYCRENLAAYKVPAEIVQVEELPKSSVGKILRRSLR